MITTKASFGAMAVAAPAAAMINDKSSFGARAQFRSSSKKKRRQ
jgi:hypothetical protein